MANKFAKNLEDSWQQCDGHKVFSMCNLARHMGP
jgi:hypothetical protein